MKRKLVFVASYFSILPLLILTLILYALYLGNQLKGISASGHPNLSQYQALPDLTPETRIRIKEEDFRIAALKDFFLRYNSELVGYAGIFVQSADRFGLDYRLLPAIAMQESNLCRKAPKNSYNCFGFGIYGGKILKFQSYEEAIRAVSKNLGHEYKAAGLEGPSEIVSRYTPSDNGLWVKSVSYFMSRIQSVLN